MKKIAIFLFSLSMICATDDSNNKENIENYDTGKSKIIQIIKNNGAIIHDNKNICLAETKNLAKDMNLAEISDLIGCKTLLGKTFIEKALTQPFNSQAKDTCIATRQASIKTLVENPMLKKEVEQLLEQAKEAEQDIIKLMSDYFKGKTCPELAHLQALKEPNPLIYSLNNFFLINPIPRTISTLLNIAGFASTAYVSAYSGIAAYQLAQMGIDYTKAIEASLYMGVIAGFSGYGAYKDYATALEKRDKIHALHTFVMVSEKIDLLCTQHGIKSQFSIQNVQDEQGRALIKKLKHRRYKNKRNYFFMTPMVHTFLYHIYEEDHQLINIFAAIAELDAYNALASKIIDSSDAPHKFCFVNFLDNQKPEVHAEGFWNILVTNPVVNDIAENKHILLTGPNKGGKSTSIKAILQNIILGQSFGIAAAREFNFTPFDIIHSYLNVSDDLINGLSLFASELKRAQDILTIVKSLQTSDQKFFFALDELFTGTAAEDGEKCAYEFVKKLATFKNTMFIYATHFSRLKELGLENTGCINYKVDAPIKNEFGILTYPFTISQGESNVNVALDLARESGLFA